MIPNIENWKTQIRKGYLELCILILIEKQNKLYGFDMLDQMEKAGLSIKEGTLYPLLSRMTAEGVLAAVWETENTKGHPRKFYSLTKVGKKSLHEMQLEFEKMAQIYRQIKK